MAKKLDYKDVAPGKAIDITNSWITQRFPCKDLGHGKFIETVKPHNTKFERIEKPSGRDKRI